MFVARKAKGVAEVPTMTRTGKIARLPRLLREQLNRRLDDGHYGPALLTWLNAQPEAQAILAEQFGARPLNKQNLSQWRQGGYRDWQQRQQEHEKILAQFRLSQTNSGLFRPNQA